MTWWPLSYAWWLQCGQVWPGPGMQILDHAVLIKAEIRCTVWCRFSSKAFHRAVQIGTLVKWGWDMAIVVYFWSLLLGLAQGYIWLSRQKILAAVSPKDEARILGTERGALGILGYLLGSRALGGNIWRLVPRVSPRLGQWLCFLHLDLGCSLLSM